MCDSRERWLASGRDHFFLRKQLFIRQGFAFGYHVSVIIFPFAGGGYLSFEMRHHGMAEISFVRNFFILIIYFFLHIISTFCYIFLQCC